MKVCPIQTPPIGLLMGTNRSVRLGSPVNSLTQMRPHDTQKSVQNSSTTGVLFLHLHIPNSPYSQTFIFQDIGNRFVWFPERVCPVKTPHVCLLCISNRSVRLYPPPNLLVQIRPQDTQASLHELSRTSFLTLHLHILPPIPIASRLPSVFPGNPEYGVSLAT